MRHKRVDWAAMEFLLKSYKKNRNWVWLKQLLLLLSRIAALLLILFMLGQVGCNEKRIGRLLGGQTTHHYVLLDDSFSMNDKASSGTAFDRALSTLSQIGARVKNRQNQKFSLLRYSRADMSDAVNRNPMDIDDHVVDNLFEQKLSDMQARLKTTSLAVRLPPALQLISELIEQRNNENAIVYVLSDFRETDWKNAAEIDPYMTRLNQVGAGIEMINCVTDQQSNLSITELTATGNVRVAGTPLMVEVTVKNCSNQVAKKVQVRIESASFDMPRPDSGPNELKIEIESLPTVFIDQIQPGQSESREFPIFMEQVGTHAVRATLADDPVNTDNVRYQVITFEPSARVLIVDDSDRLHAEFLALALSPGGMTGISPEIKTKDYLRDTKDEALDRYDVLFLSDIDKLDESAIENLEAFVQRGGGVGFFLGPRVNRSWYNQKLHRDGNGIFPIPLAGDVEIRKC